MLLASADVATFPLSGRITEQGPRSICHPPKEAVCLCALAGRTRVAAASKVTIEENLIVSGGGKWVSNASSKPRWLCARRESLPSPQSTHVQKTCMLMNNSLLMYGRLGYASRLTS